MIGCIRKPIFQIENENIAMDIVSPQKRSEMMAGIRSSNTKPEIVVRKYLYNQGFRYRISTKIQNCKPDIVLRKYKVAVFIHGCFWHRHQGCKYMTTPKTNGQKWLAKFNVNVNRDIRTQKTLLDAGWRVVVLWECWEKRKLDISWLYEWIRSSKEQYVTWPEVEDVTLDEG